ncbi:unnamed protein product [Leptidea sinapis]|uniref:unspecific monooxygenase n=1 Tax=Leptidea sinapis TaxID=189913 RepID=A0A5E4QKA2_9NEOP|nr:unnamed protein product [Leptidea sinapis]
MTSVLIVCFVLLLILCYYVMERKFKYWKQRNVPYLKPLLIFGNYKEYLTLNKTIFSVVSEIYEQFPNEPYVGAFYGTEPTLILRDPEYIKVHVPVYSLHHDADYFPEPEVFRPERFLDKDNIRQYTYMPFGGGPRICIGLRFAKMQVMAGLLTVLRKCRVELADGMPRSLEFEPRAITTQPIQEIHVKLIRR